VSFTAYKTTDKTVLVVPLKEITLTNTEGRSTLGALNGTKFDIPVRE
jgi:hypothetical protein